jgi:hypothetical protein
LNSSLTVSTRRILKIVKSDSENDDSEGPTRQIHQQSTSGDTEDDDDDATDDEDDAEDDGLQHLPASNIGATLQQEVIIHWTRKS